MLLRACSRGQAPRRSPSFGARALIRASSASFGKDQRIGLCFQRFIIDSAFSADQASTAERSIVISTTIRDFRLGLVRGSRMEIARLLHTFAGPMMALVGTMPSWRRTPAPPPALEGPVERTHDFPAVQPRESAYWPERSHILSGKPQQTATYIYKSPDGLFAAGIWTCQPGKFRIDFGRAEFIQLIAGVVTVTDA
ncbi:MAG: DUF861 domain-containing protein, partial [Alphaproteobacteria bacterium]